MDRAIQAYDLDSVDTRHESINDGLRARWRGEERHTPTGYRTLTDWFNKRLLRRVFLEHGRDALGGRVDNDYDALTGDDELLREEVVESLGADGIDASAVHDDMVSWGTMRTHLQECLAAEKSTTRSSSDWERDSIEKAKSFAREKVVSALSSLSSKGELADGDHGSVSVRIQIDCDVEGCSTRVPLSVALDRGYVCDQHAPTTTDT